MADSSLPDFALPESDAKLIEHAYSMLSHPKLTLTPAEFSERIGFRIYTEFCCDTSD